MNDQRPIYIGTDSFTLKTPEDWRDTNLVYEVTGAPRSDHLNLWFTHPTTIQLYVLQGSFAFEVDDITFVLAKGDFGYIPAGSRYRFRCKERELSKMHLYSACMDVEEAWRKEVLDH